MIEQQTRIRCDECHELIDPQERHVEVELRTVQAQLRGPRARLHLHEPCQRSYMRFAAHEDARIERLPRIEA